MGKIHGKIEKIKQNLVILFPKFLPQYSSQSNDILQTSKDNLCLDTYRALFINFGSKNVQGDCKDMCASTVLSRHMSLQQPCIYVLGSEIAKSAL